MRRLRLVLEYDGSRFCGFQRQPHQVTVQGELEARLFQICGHPVGVVGAGRTDTGVHALGQVVHFDTSGRIPVDRVARAVNSRRQDLAVRAVEETDPAFHARYSAVRRTYHYFISRRQPSPFLAPFILYEPRLKADAAMRMREALQPVLGKHDFRAFSAASAGVNTVRTLLEAKVTEREESLRVELTADGFIRSMVRVMVGWLLEIAREERDPGALSDALERQASPGAVATAPAQGLFLTAAEYADGYPGEALLNEARAWWPGGR